MQKFNVRFDKNGEIYIRDNHSGKLLYQGKVKDEILNKYPKEAPFYYDLDQVTKYHGINFDTEKEAYKFIEFYTGVII